MRHKLLTDFFNLFFFKIKQAVYKFFFFKNLQIGNFFSHPNVLHWNFKKVGNGQHNSSFGGTIQFGNS